MLIKIKKDVINLYTFLTKHTNFSFFDKNKKFVKFLSFYVYKCPKCQICQNEVKIF